MTTDEQKKNLAEKFLAGLRNRDWDLLRSIMCTDVVWTLPGRSVISGEAYGVDAVLARAQKIVSYGVTFNLKHIIIGQFGFALSLNNTAKRDDAILDEHLAAVCRLRDGKIHAIDTYLSDIAMLNAFFV